MGAVLIVIPSIQWVHQNKMRWRSWSGVRSQTERSDPNPNPTQRRERVFNTGRLQINAANVDVGARGPHCLPHCRSHPHPGALTYASPARVGFYIILGSGVRLGLRIWLSLRRVVEGGHVLRLRLRLRLRLWLRPMLQLRLRLRLIIRLRLRLRLRLMLGGGVAGSVLVATPGSVHRLRFGLRLGR